jgi:hypothetical protein
MAFIKAQNWTLKRGRESGENRAALAIVLKLASILRSPKK